MIHMLRLLLAVALLPIFLLCYYIYKKDIHEEPIKLLGKIFGLGCLTVIPVLI